MGMQPRPLAFDKIKKFDYHNLTAKYCYFRCSRSPDVDGIKIFDKDDQAAFFYLNVLQPSHLYQKF